MTAVSLARVRAHLKGGEARMFLCVCVIQRSEAKMDLAQLREEEAVDGPSLHTVERECAAEAVGTK